jgi:hypothetical protein
MQPDPTIGMLLGTGDRRANSEVEGRNFSALNLHRLELCM